MSCRGARRRRDGRLGRRDVHRRAHQPARSRRPARGRTRDRRRRCATLAVEARDHVAALTGLYASAADAPVAVVDRAAWVARQRRSGSGRVVDPLVATLRRAATSDRRRFRGDCRRRSSSRGIVDAVGSRVTGAQVGVMLGLPVRRACSASTSCSPRRARRPRLLLVAPNLLAAERAMGVDPHDFRLWVCIHEETHRVQFTAVPWLGDHLRGEVEAARRRDRPRPRPR